MARVTGARRLLPARVFRVALCLPLLQARVVVGEDVEFGEPRLDDPRVGHPVVVEMHIVPIHGMALLVADVLADHLEAGVREAEHVVDVPPVVVTRESGWGVL